MIDLYDALAAVLPKAAEAAPEEEAAPLVFGEDEDGTEFDPTKPLRIAVVGRPNAGKSTLLNAWLGEDRLLTGPEPGITRDSIGLALRWRDRDLKVFDTAGLRKRARIEDKVEKLAAADAIRAVQFAEVVVVLLDATIPFEKQDLTIAALAEREGRAIVIGVNKWDLIEARGSKLSEMRESAERLLPQIRGVPRRARLGAHRVRPRQAARGLRSASPKPGTAACRRRASTAGSRPRWTPTRPRRSADGGSRSAT